jgi:hypothetical protein
MGVIFSYYGFFEKELLLYIILDFGLPKKPHEIQKFFMAAELKAATLISLPENLKPFMSLYLKK